jgi:hypothetical protein
MFKTIKKQWSGRKELLIVGKVAKYVFYLSGKHIASSSM